MANTKKELEQEVVDLQVLEKVSKSYAEIASKRMISIRGMVVGNRSFLGSLREIFDDVRRSYRHKVEELLKKRGRRREGGLTFLAHNGKTVAVFLGANTGLYGDIVQKVFDSFLRDVRDHDYEATLVGRLGRSLFLEAEPGRLYSYFDLPDFGVEQEGLTELIKHLVQYEKIRVYYGQFHSIVRQEPVVFDLSAMNPLEEEDGSEEGVKVKRDYIFEPTLEKILTFFEAQMFGSLFEQTVRESQLSKFASRMIAMDRAGQKIRDKLKDAKTQKLQLFHRSINKKQLNSMVSLVGN